MTHAMSFWLWREKQTVLWENNAASLEKRREKKEKRRDSAVNSDGQRGIRAFCSGFIC